MGLYYLNGFGVEVDNDRAIECLKISSDNGCIEAMILLANLYEERELSESNEVLKKAANLGDSTAMYRLGYNYDHGMFVEKNSCEAVKWYQKAADLNNASAQCNLALCYLNGVGISVNLDFGIYWLERAISNDSIMAMFNLGYCYEKGIGVEENHYFALKNYLRAANAGNVDAQLAVSKLYKNEYKDYQQAIYWLNEAMKKGKDEAYLELADLYISGNIEIDENKSIMLLEQVKDKNNKFYKIVDDKVKKYMEERASI